ncbi:MAG: MATE family efflux transporter [Lachnospiraceae bacterium]|nr:MATE family efflux transporter [Lachnospiraceae bacterium]
MLEGPLLPNIIKFAIPLMLSSILQLLFNAADIVVVGQYAGDSSLGAVGCTGSLINLLTNLFVGLSVSTGVLVARYYASKQQQKLKDTIHTSMAISVISGIFLAIIGILFVRPILILMNAEGEILDKAVIYLTVYFLGMPSMMVYNFGSSILRAVGDTRRPLIYLTIAGALNVVLNLIFVIVFQMDVAGVALATILSQTLSAALVVRCLVREKGDLHFDILHPYIKKHILKRIARIGLPAGFQGVIFSLANVVIQSSVNELGDLVIDGNSIAMNLEGFVYVSMNAFHQVSISFTSQNIGAGKLHRVRPIFWKTEACVIAVGTVLGYTVLFFGRPLLGIYSDNPAIIDAGMVRLWMIMTTYMLCGMMDVCVGSIRGMGYSVMPTIVSLIGACFLRLVWLWTVFRIPQFHNASMIYITYPISWALTFSVHLICFLALSRKFTKNRLKNA